MLGSALPNTPLKGSTALVVPLQLRIHLLQTATVTVAVTLTVTVKFTVAGTLTDARYSCCYCQCY